MNVLINCVEMNKSFPTRLVMLSLLSGAAIAAEPSTPSTGRLLLGLIFMVVLIFVGAWLIRRAPQLNSQGVIKVVASTAVGTRERVVLLQVGQQQVLVGVTANQISHLHTLNENVELPVAAPLNFQEALQKVLKSNKST
jgi:flagellar protein FliO/FliZ